MQLETPQIGNNFPGEMALPGLHGVHGIRDNLMTEAKAEKIVSFTIEEDGMMQHVNLVKTILYAKSQPRVRIQSS